MKKGLIFGLFLLSFVLIGSFGVVSGAEYPPEDEDTIYLPDGRIYLFIDVENNQGNCKEVIGRDVSCFEYTKKYRQKLIGYDYTKDLGSDGQVYYDKVTRLGGWGEKLTKDEFDFFIKIGPNLFSDSDYQVVKYNDSKVLFFQDKEGNHNNLWYNFDRNLIILIKSGDGQFVVEATKKELVNFPSDLDLFGFGEISSSKTEEENASSSCVPKWECIVWTDCSDNLVKRTCKDLKNCGDDSLRPLEEKPCSNETSVNGTCENNECSLNDKCISIGYRNDGEYCSLNGNFIPQLGANAQCNNNFECGSNVCVSGQCIETSLIQKILEWFKNLFGG